MKVTVIGAGGFVGQRVAAQLAADPDVTALSLVDRAGLTAPEGAHAQMFNGDFSDPDLRGAALDGADAVIMLAAILGGAAEADYGLARAVNVDATLDLFEYLRDTAPLTRMVFASTIAVYAMPLPDPVTDATPFAPTMVYGAQKLMMEVALSNFTAKGWLDGVSLRPSGVMARDGADAGLKSAFMSRLFWSVRRGEDITLPVAQDSRSWLTSVDTVAANFIHAAKLPEIGAERAFTLPALSLTFGELVAALHARFPDSPSRVTFDPDPATVALFGQFPRLETETADRLGFKRDADAPALVDAAFA
ncbi:NAD-dependent epimerase/dehydratase family protein [Maritimibacter sp. UBA3975]|uniref:NAD-dependent epimerase/dehydratase family protein n=1 Tax=Maritimibacter sp. UBA3975 TaxID=1946833 RepID=UPI000C0B21B2|nr:NAD-dependent epimerase/dehydratase family protein [Maritimibacter sp. UBA3975]MAM60776.1 UDP-glucose 4-epimerase [Maritimibacter sp.]|tara:strand:+ start:38525 stop:39439 length:915 start_codon:yes stop_codon:yes gene_type:complete